MNGTNETQESTKIPKIALLVAGVGRSGTSALTRVVNLLGAALPDRLLDENPGNERGYWEPWHIVELSEEILRCFGSDWYDSRPLPEGWFETARAKGYIERASEVIEGEYRGAALIAIKDPRLCRLAPIYLAALQQLGYEARAIIPMRNPGEMAASIHRREGTDRRSGELIWIRHMLEVEAATRHIPRVWTAYDGLMKDWRSVVRHISSTLRFDWPRDPDEVGNEINEFLSPSLRHFGGEGAPADGSGALAAQIWDALERGRAGCEQQIRQRFDGVRALVDDMDRLNAVHIDPDRAQVELLRGAIIDLDESLRALRNSTVAKLERQFALLVGQAEMVQEKAADAWARAAILVPEVTGFVSSEVEPSVPVVFETIVAALEKQHSDYEILRDDRDTLLRSRSWTFTRPLRDWNARMQRFRARWTGGGG